MIFCSILWQVTKTGFTISSLKRNGRVWNGTVCILYQKRRQKQCHQLQSWWVQSSWMQGVWFWPNSWNLGKRSLLLIMSRHCTSSVVHCAINVRDETLSFCMTTLTPTPLASHRKQLQRWGGKFFYTPPIALIWHSLTTIFLDLWRISCFGRYETMEAIQKAVCQCLRMAGTEFYRRGIFILPERWEKCVQRSGDYVEK